MEIIDYTIITINTKYNVYNEKVKIWMITHYSRGLNKLLYLNEKETEIYIQQIVKSSFRIAKSCWRLK